MSKRLKTIINIFAIILIVASVNIIISSFSMMMFYNRENLFYIINAIAILLIINSIVLILKENYKIFIIVFLSILSFSFIFSAANYIKYANNIERYKILKKDKEVHNSLDRVLAKDRFLKLLKKEILKE